MNTMLFYEREEISASPQEFGCLTLKHYALENPTTNPCSVPHGDKDFAATLEHK